MNHSYVSDNAEGMDMEEEESGDDLSSSRSNYFDASQDLGQENEENEEDKDDELPDLPEPLPSTSAASRNRMERSESPESGSDDSSDRSASPIASRLLSRINVRRSKTPSSKRRWNLPRGSSVAAHHVKGRKAKKQAPPIRTSFRARMAKEAMQKQPVQKKKKKVSTLQNGKVNKTKQPKIKRTVEEQRKIWREKARKQTAKKKAQNLQMQQQGTGASNTMNGYVDRAKGGTRTVEEQRKIWRDQANARKAKRKLLEQAQKDGQLDAPPGPSTSSTSSTAPTSRGRPRVKGPAGSRPAPQSSSRPPARKAAVKRRASSDAQAASTSQTAQPAAPGKKRGRPSASKKKPSEEEKTKIQMQRQDVRWLKLYDLHYPGKRYSLLKPQEEIDKLPLPRDYVKEILDRDGETLKDWEARHAREEAEGKADEEEFVVGTAPYDGIWDESERPMDLMILVKYRGYPCAYWVPYTTEIDRAGGQIVQWFRWREQAVSKARAKMQTEYLAKGKDFNKDFPQVFLPEVNQNWEYATHPSLKRQTLLRARETTINEHQARVGGPPIVLADWTGQEDDESNLMTFIWTNEMTRSRRVQEIVDEKLDDGVTTRCGVNCVCVGGDKKCWCAVKELTKRRDVTVECGPECACASQPQACSNRVFQNGRQFAVFVVRMPDIGWTARALEDVPADAFVSGYAGKVFTAAENDQMDQMYAMDVWFQPVDKQGQKHRNFVCNSLDSGSESRFCSHSCKYNLDLAVYIVERDSKALSYTGFKSIREIKCGEELSITYHGDQLLDARIDKKKFTSKIIKRCLCGWGDECYIEPWTDQDHAEHKEEEEERKRGTREDSFAENVNEPEKEDRTARNERRDAEKAAKEASGSPSSSKENSSPNNQ